MFARSLLCKLRGQGPLAGPKRPFLKRILLDDGYLHDNFWSLTGLECINNYLFEKANSLHRDSVPRDCEAIVGQSF